MKNYMPFAIVAVAVVTAGDGCKGSQPAGSTSTSGWSCFGRWRCCSRVQPGLERISQLVRFRRGARARLD